MLVVDRILSLLAPHSCAACDARLHRDAAFCVACLATLTPPPPLPVGTTASFAFGGALATAIRRFKYGDRADLARPLRRLVVESLPDARDVDAVVPLPLHARRLRSRGFDQSSLLAGAVARALGRPRRIDLLVRVVDTPHLAALDADARLRTVAGAFASSPRAAGLRLLVVDDVRTTGATLAAAASALTDTGASVRAHVLAATPR